MGVAWSCRGWLFRSVGALAENAPAPKVHNLVRGTASRSWSEDHRAGGGGRGSVRYGGESPSRDLKVSGRI